MTTEKNDWIDFAGGDCPVEVGTRIQYRVRSGYTSGALTITRDEVHSVMWAHNTEYDPSTDIVAYRVVQS